MHPNDGRVVSNFIVQALADAPITLYGAGSQPRSFGNVDDPAGGLVGLMESGDDLDGPVTLGHPAEMAERAPAERIVALTGAKSRIEHRPPVQDDPTRSRPAISLAHARLGWAPVVALDGGLARPIQYFDRLLGGQGRPGR